MTDQYAQRKANPAGGFDVTTPGRGFTQIKGLDEQTAYAVTTAINRAYANGVKDIQTGLKDLLGVTGGSHD